MSATQGIDFLAPLTPGQGTTKAHAVIRNIVPHLDKDRFLSPEIKKIYSLIKKGTLVDEVEQSIGSLDWQ